MPRVDLRSKLAPTGFTGIDEREFDRRDPKQRDDRRCVRIVFHAIVMRRPRDAPDESAGRHRNRVVRIKVGAAVHPPRARENKREAIGGVGVGALMKPGYHFISTR